MKYIIMLLIVIGLAAADFLTGIIKGYCTDIVQSSKMRKGGLNKLAEIIVMTSACGLDAGIKALGAYYQADGLSDIAGAVTASVVFGYISIMEIVSIFENYAALNPKAEWVSKLLKKLKNSGK